MVSNWTGADVVLACRNTDKAAPVATSIGERAQVRVLDLADLASVRRFADSVETVDVLINNAGVMAAPYGTTVDGFERQIGTNHLGHFALTASGSPIRAVAAHPGYAATNLQSHTESPMDLVMWVGNKVVAQSAEMGALPGLYAATFPDVEGGAFYGPNGFQHLRGYPTRVGSNKESRDEALAGKLWDLSERLTGVHYSF